MAIVTSDRTLGSMSETKFKICSVCFTSSSLFGSLWVDVHMMRNGLLNFIRKIGRDGGFESFCGLRYSLRMINIEVHPPRTKFFQYWRSWASIEHLRISTLCAKECKTSAVMIHYYPTIWEVAVMQLEVTLAHSSFGHLSSTSNYWHLNFPHPLNSHVVARLVSSDFRMNTLESWQQEIVANLSWSWAQSSPCPLSILRICISLIPVTGDSKFWFVHRTFLKPAEVRAAEQQMRATLNIWFGVPYEFERSWWLVM